MSADPGARTGALRGGVGRGRARAGTPLPLPALERRGKERALVLACRVRVWPGQPPGRPLPWWQEVPGNYKSRHAGNIPLLLPGNVLCPALQEAPVRSQPGSQPDQPASPRPPQPPPPPPQQHKGRRAAAQGSVRARAALAPRRRAGKSVAAAGVTTAWGWGWSGSDPSAVGLGCAPVSGWRSCWAKLWGAHWTAVRSPGEQGPRARRVLLRPPSPG